MAANSIRIMCPSLTCRRILAVPETARGKTVRCKGCGTCIRVPDKAKAQSGPAPKSET
jgi:Pyruvate/2-oxoacid:ferredoxin oxidoreductase delta subunit